MAKKAYVYDGSAWVEITSQPSIATATTGNQGIVQLTDSVTSTSTATAAVPNSVKTAYDQAVTATTNAATAQSAADSKAAVGSTTPSGVAATAAVGTSVQAARADHAHNGLISVSGTTNQITASTTAGAVTLSTPQNIHTTATPTFSGLTLNGDVTLNAQSDLRFADSDSSNWLALQAPATVASNVTWTLPSTDGTNGQVLETNGSGTLLWGTSGERVLLASAAAGTTDIVISNIPSTYSDIEIFMWGTAALDTVLDTFTLSTGTMDASATAYGGFNQAAFVAGTDTSGTFRFPRASTFGADGGNHNIGIIRMPDFSNKSGLNNKPRAMYGFALTPPASSSVAMFTYHCALYNPATTSAAVTGFTVNRTASVAILVYGIP